MEYLISTTKLESSKKIGKLYIQGEHVLKNGYLYVFEGDFIYEDVNDIEKLSDADILKKNIVGNFNYFRYNTETDDFIIKNDKFGTYSLYIYQSDEKFIISNNVWKIIKILDDDEIIIDKDFFQFYITTFGTDIDGKTLFKNITDINAATNIQGNLRELNKLKFEKYYDLVQKTNKKLTIKDAVNKLDEDLSFTFDRIKQNNPNKILGFGNSGGLDSRLIPIYANQSGIKIQGLTTLNKYSSKAIKSITYLNAQKIAKVCKFDNKYINYTLNNYEERNLLDIRNNPFGTSEIFKNPYDKMPNMDYYVTGGNGFIVGGAWEKIVNLKDKDFVKEFMLYNSKLRLFISNEKSKIITERLFGNDYTKKINRTKIRFYEENSQKDKFSIIRSFHQFSLNKRSPAGGFESVNRLYKTYNIYYPIVFENTLKWDEDFFYNRIILKSLIEKKSKQLFNIPSQNLERLSNKHLGLAGQIRKNIILRYRTWGLDYGTWVQDESFLKYAESIMKRKNNLFFELLNISEKTFLNLKIFQNLHPHLALDMLKIKKILDLFVYKEFDFINNEKFTIK